MKIYSFSDKGSMTEMVDKAVPSNPGFKPGNSGSQAEIIIFKITKAVAIIHPADFIDHGTFNQHAKTDDP
ncbi:MAG: hypothetical protein PVI00_15295 [Desulfobacterales bacterium]